MGQFSWAFHMGREGNVQADVEQVTTPGRGQSLSKGTKEYKARDIWHVTDALAMWKEWGG